MCFDATGGYTVIWAVAVILGALAAAVSFAIREESREPSREAMPAIAAERAPALPARPEAERAPALPARPERA